MSMNPRFLVVAIFSLGVLTACASEGTYPISGMPVGANDPVRDMNSGDYLIFGAQSY